MSEFEYAGVPGPDLTVTSVAPMIMRHGTEQNKKEFLPGIAQGRDRLRARLLRAQRRHRPGQPAHPRGSRRRRVGDQRVEDLEQRGPAVDPRMAVCANRSRCAAAPRDIGDRGAGRQPRHRDPPADRLVGIPHQRDVLQRRARAGHQSDRRGQRRVDLHHRRAGPRARRVDQRRRSAARARRPDRDGGFTANRRSAAASRRPRPTSRSPS